MANSDNPSLTGSSFSTSLQTRLFNLNLGSDMEIKTSGCKCLQLSAITPYPIPYYRYLLHDTLLTKKEAENGSGDNSNEVSLRMKVRPENHFVAISVDALK